MTRGRADQSKPGVQIDEIDFTQKSTILYSSVQVSRIMASGRPVPRVVFEDKDRVYKVWRSDYSMHRLVFSGDSKIHADLVGLDGIEHLPGHLFGFFDDEIASSFISGIYSGTRLAGYIMKKGQVLPSFNADDPIHRNFLESVIDRSLKSGFAFRDLKPNNIVRMPDGRLSLIDLDTPLASLAHLSVERESAGGSLASFTLPEYRKFIADWLNPRSRNVDVLAARERMAREPAIFLDDPEPLVESDQNPERSASWLHQFVHRVLHLRSP